MSIEMNKMPENHEQIGMEDRSPKASKDDQVLESDVSLSRSVIWELQRQFYVQRGLKAWTEDMVPQFITNNPFIAEIYARIVAAFLFDCINLEGNGLSPRNPLRILELGAGPGKFSYLFLRHLTALLREKRMPIELVRYCMTDCSENMIQAWRSNAYLAEFVDLGILEFEFLQADEMVQSSFVAGRKTSGPMVLIANYVFDSLPQDAFVITEGQIFEALVTTVKKGRQSEDSPAEKLSDLQLSFKNVNIPPNRYLDPAWNEILELYRSRLSAATVLFPAHALKPLQELSNFTDGRLLVLAADKAITHEDVLLLSQGPPTLEFHASNCFSQVVNFDAIGKYFKSIGGEALAPDKHHSSLSICAFLHGRPGDQFPATGTAYRESQAAFGPDDLFALLAWLNPHMEEMSVSQILAVLRLSQWDPIALMRLFPVLARQLRTIAAERQDLRNAVLRTWANHYPVSPGENILAFQCGVILLELRFFEDASLMFKTSQRILAASAATSYNLGLCAQGLGNSADALAYMAEACELDPGFEPARLSRLKLESAQA
jgi:tetratricopeptide (TPR) repeat protein